LGDLRSEFLAERKELENAKQRGSFNDIAKHSTNIETMAKQFLDFEKD